MNRRTLLTGMGLTPVVLSLPAVSSASVIPPPAPAPRERELQVGDAVVVNIRYDGQAMIVEDIDEQGEMIGVVWFDEALHRLLRMHVPRFFTIVRSTNEYPPQFIKRSFLSWISPKEEMTLSPENNLLRAIVRQGHIDTKTAMRTGSYGHVVEHNGSRLLIISDIGPR